MNFLLPDRSRGEGRGGVKNLRLLQGLGNGARVRIFAFSIPTQIGLYRVSSLPMQDYPRIAINGYIGFVTIGAMDFRKPFFGVDDMAK